MDFLQQIPEKAIDTGRDLLTLFPLGNFEDGNYELVGLNPQTVYSPHIHDHSSARLRIVYGSGCILLDGKAFPYNSGASFSVPAGVSHGFEVEEATLLLSIQDKPIIDAATGKVDLRYVD